MHDEARTITLPSGKPAEVRRGKGRDLMRAHRAVVGNPEPLSVSFALIAELARVEGKALVYEDILEMDLDDVLTLDREVSGQARTRQIVRSPRRRRRSGRTSLSRGDHR